MTEAEWLACDDPRWMLGVLSAGNALAGRKSRLFTVALCRRIWALMPMDRHRDAVEVAERYADGMASDVELAAAKRSLHGGRLGKTYGRPQKAAAAASWHTVGAQTYYCPSRASAETSSARWSAGVRGPDEQSAGAQQAHLLREIVGPSPAPTRAPMPEAILTWNDRVIPRLAAEAYTARSLPSGHLDPARLAVLSDALEEAGCTDAGILAHLRSPGPHVRGCWALDLVLGRG